MQHSKPTINPPKDCPSMVRKGYLIAIYISMKHTHKHTLKISFIYHLASSKVRVCIGTIVIDFLISLVVTSMSNLFYTKPIYSHHEDKITNYQK